MVEGVQDLVAKADQISAQEFVSFFPAALRCVSSAVCMPAINMKTVRAAWIKGLGLLLRHPA